MYFIAGSVQLIINFTTRDKLNLLQSTNCFDVFIVI